eukprot:scaffold225470_cov64-Attheya_sp.AAC.7
MPEGSSIMTSSQGVEHNTLYRYVRGLPAPCTYRYGVVMSKDRHRIFQSTSELFRNSYPSQ